jgi:hypothetical protein
VQCKKNQKIPGAAGLDKRAGQWYNKRKAGIAAGQS